MDDTILTSNAERGLSSNVSTAGLRHVLRRFARRCPPWNSASLATAGAIAFFWWVGSWFIAGQRDDQFSLPAMRSPEPTRNAINNNRSAQRMLAVDLEGTAVLYPREVNSMVAPER